MAKHRVGGADRPFIGGPGCAPSSHQRRPVTMRLLVNAASAKAGRRAAAAQSRPNVRTTLVFPVSYTCPGKNVLGLRSMTLPAPSGESRGKPRVRILVPQGNRIRTVFPKLDLGFFRHSCLDLTSTEWPTLPTTTAITARDTSR